jgi:hypothetical protein
MLEFKAEQRCFSALLFEALVNWLFYFLWLKSIGGITI